MEAYDDGKKKYIMQREQKSKKQAQNLKILSYPEDGVCDDQEINVFVLFNDKDQRHVNNMQAKLANKKILFTMGLAETPKAYGKKGDIIKCFDYVTVIVSKSFLEDLDLLDILVENYKIGKKNKKMLPIIVWKELYEPEVKAEVLQKMQTRIDDYKNRYFKNDFNGVAVKDLQRMQKKLKMLEHFIDFAIERDQKRNIPSDDKLLKYIRFVSGKDVADKESVPENKGVVVNKTINVNGKQVYIATDNAKISTTESQINKSENTTNDK